MDTIDYHNMAAKDMSHNVRKSMFGHVRPVQIQIRLRIRAVWSEASPGALWIAWIAKDATFLQVDNEDSTQTAVAQADFAVVSW